MVSPGEKNSSQNDSKSSPGTEKKEEKKKSSPGDSSEASKPESKEKSTTDEKKKSPEEKNSSTDSKDSDEKFSDVSDKAEVSKSDEPKSKQGSPDESKTGKDEDSKKGKADEDSKKGKGDEDSKKGKGEEDSKKGKAEEDSKKAKVEESKNKTEESKKQKSKVEDVKLKSKLEDSKGKRKTIEQVKSKLDEVKAKSKIAEKSKLESTKVKSKVLDESQVDEKKDKSRKLSPTESDSSLASTHSGISRKSKKVSTEQALRIGFMGAGRMTDCFIRGLLKGEKVQAKNIIVSAKSGKNLDSFKSNGVKTTQRTYDLFGKYRCDVIFLCVHGFVVRNCFKMGGTRPFPLTTNYVPSRKSKYYVLSMIGGIPISDIKVVLLNPEQHGSCSATFHRVAMNASVAYGIGLGAIDVEFDSKKCSPVVRDLLSSLAKMVTIDEGSMDAACAVGGNGLAIIYYFISALSDGGFKMGLSKNASIKLAAKVMNVAAMAVLESNLNLADLRDACCSPSGAAIYGLAVMEKNDMASGIQSAVDAAYRRIKQLCEIEG